MVQSPSWAANWFAASQEIPRISRNPKVHYRTHKRPPPVSILGQPNSVHISTSHLLQIHPNIIHPSTRRFPQWSLSLRFPHQDPVHPHLLTHTRHMPFFAWYWEIKDILIPKTKFGNQQDKVFQVCPLQYSRSVILNPLLKNGLSITTNSLKYNLHSFGISPREFLEWN
jgi:hypothetical protein